jgi:hypothetical protein
MRTQINDLEKFIDFLKGNLKRSFDFVLNLNFS